MLPADLTKMVWRQIGEKCLSRAQNEKGGALVYLYNVPYKISYDWLINNYILGEIFNGFMNQLVTVSTLSM